NLRRLGQAPLSRTPGHGHGVEQCGPLQRHCSGSLARRMGDEPMAVSCVARPVWNDCPPDRADEPGTEERLVLWTTTHSNVRTTASDIDRG
ncbi:MAG: hypothetical protein M1499_06895, partial [Firmicutes bacterium]|nr:hypothetical protein [Bacillota bacterium]